MLGPLLVAKLGNGQKAVNTILSRGEAMFEFLVLVRWEIDVVLRYFTYVVGSMPAFLFFKLFNSRG